MRGRGILVAVVAIALVVGMALLISAYTTQDDTIPTADGLIEYLVSGDVKEVSFVGYYQVKVTEYKGARVNWKINISSRDSYSARLEAIKAGENGEEPITFTIKYDNPNQVTFTDYLLPIAMLLIVGFMLVFLFRQIGKQNNQGMAFGKSKTRVNDNIKVRFSDVAGADEEKEELAEVVAFLKNPGMFSELGARVPRGILLVGPPGTGKTLLAKAVAGEAGVPFFSISGSDFVELYVGIGAARVRDLFEQAKKNMPSIIFIDEIDAVGRQRGAGLGGGHDEREQTLNQLLVQMDGFETSTGIIVMAATNRADILDPALLRPGRFDRQINVYLPDVRGREEILKVHSRNKPIGSDVDFKIVARITAGFTGADLENLLNEAAILAVRDARKQISMIDINEAVNKVTLGPAKKSRLVTDRDKRITAYHEAGHAIVGWVLKRKVHEVTIIPRGHAGGFTSYRPDNDNQFMTKQELLDDIATSLGGRVAEELILENITTGASGDIRSLTAYAHKMVAEWGFSDKVGAVYFGSEGEVFVGKHYQTQASYSQEMSALIDREVARIVSEEHQRCTKILNERIDILHNFARVLLEVETITTDEVGKLVDGSTPEDIISIVGRRNEDNKNARNTLREKGNARSGFDNVLRPKAPLASPN